MRLRIIDETRDVAIGSEHFRIVARDTVLRANHYARGRVVARMKRDTLVLTHGQVTIEARLESERRLRVRCRIALPRGWRLMLRRKRVAQAVREYLAEVFGSYEYEASPRRVFCVGFQKTGTTSLAVALRTLGICCLDDAPWLLDELRRGNFALGVFDEYDAFSDNPFPPLYRELDRRFPGSLFILTIRDTDSWLESVQSMFEALPGFPMERWLYGVEGFDMATCRATFEQHNADVRSYFRNRPESLLVMDLQSGDAWNELCRFLDRPVPDRAFPHANRCPSKPSSSASTSSNAG